MAEQRYAATLVTERGRVFVPVPFNPDANWGFKVEHHVRGTINEMDVRGVLEPLDDGRGLVLGPVWRRDRHLESGAAVEVMLEPEGHSATTLPTTSRRRWLGIRLQEHSSTRSQFYRRAHLRYIDAIKRRPDERTARIAEVVGIVAAGVKERPRA
jgi:hypothetical protein